MELVGRTLVIHELRTFACDVFQRLHGRLMNKRLETIRNLILRQSNSLKNKKLSKSLEE
jgi:hypothetical protein